MAINHNISNPETSGPATVLRFKVVHISNSYKGGAGRAAWRVHEALLEHGVDSHFLSRDPVGPAVTGSNWVGWKFVAPGLLQKIKNRMPSLARGRKQTLIDRLGLISDRLSCEKASLPYSGFELWNQPVIQEADIVHLHSVNDILDYPSFFSRLRKPLVWTLHDMNPMLGLYHYRNDEITNAAIASTIDRKVLAMKKKTYQSCHSPLLVATPSRWMLEEVSNSESLHRFPVKLIPYSLNLAVFRPAPRNELRKKLNLPTGKIILLFSCERLTIRRKGFDLLLEALKSIQDIDILMLVAIGDRYKDDKATDIPVYYTGTIEDDELMAAYYGAADAFVLPSREDNLPNVMLESLACGTPVIGYAVGGIKEHVSNFTTGILAHELTAGGLAAAIRLFITSRQQFDTTTIRDYATSNFSTDRQAAAYLELYRACV